MRIWSSITFVSTATPAEFNLPDSSREFLSAGAQRPELGAPTARSRRPRR